jgi:hypothetical protein
MDKNAIHGLEEILAERRVTLVRATILDRDNQPLATGTATPVTEGARGTFWVDDLEQADTLASRAAILRRSDGSANRLLRFERCPHAHYSRHFHFEVYRLALGGRPFVRVRTERFSEKVRSRVVLSEGVIPPHEAVEPMPVSEVDALIRNDFIKNL